MRGENESGRGGNTPQLQVGGEMRLKMEVRQRQQFWWLFDLALAVL